MTTLYFATGNENKLREARGILSEHAVESKKLDLPELQGEKEDIIKEKARLAAEMLGHSVFVDDTSLCFTALQGLPGPYIKDFLTKLGRDGLVKMLDGFEDKSALAVALIGYCEPGKEAIVFEGSTPGRIIPPQDKGKGFGWDAIFLPDGSEESYAEMAEETKNKISHRARALRKFKEFLDKK